MATPDELWVSYQQAVAAAGKAQQALNEACMAGGTSLRTGQLYTAAYQAQQAADLAYQAWQDAQGQAFPGARG